MTAISLNGGEAHGAWFEGHALEGAPDEIRVAVGGESGPALLDLPSDQLEIGEHVVTYQRVSLGHICGRGRGGRCGNYAIYEPIEGLDPETRRKLLRRDVADDVLWPVGA